MSESEAFRLAWPILNALEAGGWPQETFRLRTQGIQAIIAGREPAPAAFWRYLVDGINHLRVPGTVEGEPAEILEGLREMRADRAKTTKRNRNA